MNILRGLIALMAFLIIVPSSIHAQDKPVPKPTPTPAVTIVTGGSLFRAGETVVIDEAVDGDVYCAGQSVTVRAPVAGDVICAAQNLSIEGDVTGSVRVVGQHINLASAVGRNVTALGQSITVSQGGSIGGELLGAGQTIQVNGVVGQWIKVAGQSVSLNGQVGADASVAAETLTVGADAVIQGGLSYQATKQTIIPASAKIAGPVSFTEIKDEKMPQKKQTMFKWPNNAVGTSLIYIAVGLLIVIFAKKLFPSVTGVMREKPMWTLVWGVVGVVFTPFVLLVLTLTIIGIPAALLLGMFYAFILMGASLFSAVVVGQWVLEALAPKVKGNAVYQVLIGVPITFLTLKMPFLGLILSPFALFWGVGGIVSAILAKRKK